MKNSLKATTTLILGIISFIVLEALIFNTSFYRNFLEPTSYSGNFECAIRKELMREKNKEIDIAAIGDSSLAEGFSEKIADKLLSKTNIKISNVAITGSMPRVWYYLLREIDPKCDRYDAIIICVNSYNDYDDCIEDYSNHKLDIKAVITRMDYLDIPTFAGDFRTLKDKIHVGVSMLFKGFILHEDIRDFILNPIKRMERVQKYYNNHINDIYNYEGNSEQFSGLSYNADTQKLTLPNTATENQKYWANNYLKRRLGKADGSGYRYRKKWYQKIVDRYNGKSTVIIFVQLPLHPVLPIPPLQPDPPSSIRELSNRYNIFYIEESYFKHLEKQEYYFDIVHLNNYGRQAFTKALVLAVLTKNMID